MKHLGRTNNDMELPAAYNIKKVYCMHRAIPIHTTSSLVPLRRQYQFTWYYMFPMQKVIRKNDLKARLIKARLHLFPITNSGHHSLYNSIKFRIFGWRKRNGWYFDAVVGLDWHTHQLMEGYTENMRPVSNNRLIDWETDEEATPEIFSYPFVLSK